jgi:hypothetical protein
MLEDLRSLRDRLDRAIAEIEPLAEVLAAWQAREGLEATREIGDQVVIAGVGSRE